MPGSESCSQTSLIGQDLTESDKPLGPSSLVFLKHILSNSYKGQGNSAGCRQGKLLFVTQPMIYERYARPRQCKLAQASVELQWSSSAEDLFFSA